MQQNYKYLGITLSLISLPDKEWISMRKVSERNRNRFVEVQQVFQDAQAELKEAQITAVGAMEDDMEFLLD